MCVKNIPNSSHSLRTSDSLAFFLGGGTLVEYGGSQARGLIGAVETSLHHIHSCARSEQRLRPTPTAQGNAGFLTH